MDKPADKGSSEIVHAPNLKNKIGAGSPCTIRRRVYAHSELEKLWRESDPLRRGRIAARATARQERLNVKKGLK